MPLSRTELKHIAQVQIMHGIANVLGYWDPDDDDAGVPEAQRDELREIMQREADRAAKVLGYEKAWVN